MRLRVRPLTAVRQRTTGRVRLPNQQEVLLYPGDWIISAGEQVIDTASAKTFGERYEMFEAGLVLDRVLCTRIEQTTGIGTTRTPEALTGAIERLAKIEIGHIQIDFTPGQLEEIKHRAEKRGFTVEQELSRIVERIRDEIFYKS